MALRAYNAYLGIEFVGDAWRLTKDDRAVTCTITTHPLGWDLWARVDGEMWKTQVCRTEIETLETARAWRLAWEAKGWTG
jgi:hypothetical protein